MKTALVSSSEDCAAVVGAAGLADLFDVTVDGIDADRMGLRKKPAPGMLIEAACRLEVDPFRVIVIDDCVEGVDAACAGMFGLAIALARSGDEEAFRESGADLVVRDLQDLPTDDE